MIEVQFTEGDQNEDCGNEAANYLMGNIKLVDEIELYEHSQDGLECRAVRKRCVVELVTETHIYKNPLIILKFYCKPQS